MPTLIIFCMIYAYQLLYIYFYELYIILSVLYDFAIVQFLGAFRAVYPVTSARAAEWLISLLVLLQLARGSGTFEAHGRVKQLAGLL